MQYCNRCKKGVLVMDTGYRGNIKRLFYFCNKCTYARPLSHDELQQQKIREIINGKGDKNEGFARIISGLLQRTD